MIKHELILSLESAMLVCREYEQLSVLTKMKINEMERILKEEQNWDSQKRIYIVGERGYFKTKVPVQMCKAKRDDIITKVFEFYYGTTSFSLNYCYKKAMEEFEVEVKENEKASTSKAIYLSNWERFFANYSIAQKDINKIKKQEIIAHLKVIVRKYKLSRRGLNDAKTILNKAFDWASNNDIVVHPISKDISTKNIVCRHLDDDEIVYTDDEREILLAIMEKDDHVASRALALMFCLCVRSGEIRALKWSDVNWKKGTIYIHSQISRTHDEDGHNIYVDAGMTKNKDVTGNRHQKLSSKAISILKQQRSINPFSTYIFEYNGHVLEPNMLNRRLKKICAMADIPYMSTHKIRFWSVTKMFQANVNSADVQAQAGHKDPATTNHYKRVGRLGTLDDKIVEAIYG